MSDHYSPSSGLTRLTPDPKLTTNDPNDPNFGSSARAEAIRAAELAKKNQVDNTKYDPNMGTQHRHINDIERAHINKIEKDPDQARNERMARIVDVLNNHAEWIPSVYHGGVGRNGVRSSSFRQGHYMQRPKIETEDTRMSAARAQNEASRQMWNSGQPAEQAHVGLINNQIGNVYSDLNKLYTTFQGLDLNKTMNDQALDAGARKQMVSAMGQIQSIVEDLRSGNKQALARFQSMEALTSWLRQLNEVFSQPDIRKQYSMLMSMGLGQPGMFYGAGQTAAYGFQNFFEWMMNKVFGGDR